MKAFILVEHFPQSAELSRVLKVSHNVFEMINFVEALRHTGPDSAADRRFTATIGEPGNAGRFMSFRQDWTDGRVFTIDMVDFQ